MADEKDDDLVAVGEGADAPAGETVQVEDERVAQRSDDAPDDADTGDTAADEARRAERRERKQRQKEAKERNQRELSFLRKRNEDLERRFSQYDVRQTQTEVALFDDRISQVDNQLRTADGVIAEAVKRGEGESLVEAQNIRQQLLERKQQLAWGKHQAVQRAQQAAQPQQAQQQADDRPAGPDPEVVAAAEAWRSKNPWFKPDRSDDDSAVVAAIDDRLMNEGFDPTSDEYWQELDSRLHRVLPHRFKQSNGKANGAARGGPAMANGGRERALRPGEVYVSPDRRKAMEDAGVWDDPKLRTRYLKAYADYDKGAASSRS